MHSLPTPSQRPLCRCVKTQSVSRILFVTFLAILAFSASALAQGAGYWHTSGNQILDSNNQAVRIAGINWYGFETTDQIAHGLWAQDYHTVLNQIKNNGYNVIRLPFSNQLVETPAIPTNFTQNANGQPANTDLVGLNALQVMDKIISAAGAVGLRVIIDNHRSEAGNSAEANGLWYTSAFPESAWINDWVTIVNRYKNFTDPNGNPIVIGADLRNEPHLNANGAATGACWTGDTATAGCPTTNTAQNWPAAATRAGNAVLAANPNLLVIVEGAECYNGDCDWWGGNLEGVASNPVTLSVANRLVYSPHDYGPTLFQQSWFNSSTTFASLSAVWTKFWAYISANNTAPIWVGEFGTTNNATDIQNATPGSQGQWFQSLVNFLQNNPNLGWTYWALNGEDSFAPLTGQYDGIANSTKQSLLATIQFPLGSGGTPNFSLSASPTAITVNRGSSVTSTISVARTGGFTGSVSLAIGTLPTGVTGSCTPNPITGTSCTLTISASSSATLGSSNVTLTGTNGTLSHTATIALTVAPASTPDFSLSAAPATLSIAQGSSSASTITVTPSGGFTGSVALAVTSTLPAGVTASFSPTSTTGTGTLTLAVSATATAGGPVTVTVTGTSGTLSHTATVALTVTSGGGNGGVTVTPTVPQSSPWFSEEDLTIANTGSLSALSVTIVVQRTTGISFSGEYNTVGGQIAQGNSSTSAAVTYTFTLASGQTLGAATNRLFAAQMSGTGTAHPTSGDTYTVTYTTGGQNFTQTGHF